MNQDKRIALLIDAENVSHNYKKIIMNELVKYGTTTYRRIYGDFTSGTISWTSDDMLKNSLTPIQQFSNTSQKSKNAGKNSSDITLVIDAMDILYSGNVDGFCIVSSDSDFTKLASRLREAGKLVIGMGEEKTPITFRKACEKFILLDVLSKANAKKTLKANDKSDKNEKPSTEKEKTKKQSPNQAKATETAIKDKEEAVMTDDTAHEAPPVMPLSNISALIKTEILPELADEDGWAGLADIGNRIYKLYSDFDSRNYGYSKLSTLFKSSAEFEVKSQKNGSIVNYLIREKE